MLCCSNARLGNSHTQSHTRSLSVGWRHVTFSHHVQSRITLPETNIGCENRPKPKGKVVSQPPFLRGELLISGGVVTFVPTLYIHSDWQLRICLVHSVLESILIHTSFRRFWEYRCVATMFFFHRKQYWVFKVRYNPPPPKCASSTSTSAPFNTPKTTTGAQHFFAEKQLSVSLRGSVFFDMFT